MSLRDEVAALATRRPGPRCTTGAVIDGLDDVDRADLGQLLADPLVQGSLIARALMARGLPVKPQGVNRHRRRLCDCTPQDAA